MARQLRKEIYELSRDFPKEEMFGLSSQLRRAATSISANLSEGSGRASNLDKANFTNMAYTSALEIIDHLVGALDLHYIEEDKYCDLRNFIDQIINKLNALYRYQLKDEVSLKKKL